MQSKLDDSKRLVTQIRDNLSDWQHSSMPVQYRGAKEDLINAIKSQVTDLEDNLSDKTKVDQAHEALLNLHNNTNKAQLLSNAVIMTYERTKDEKIDPKTVLNNATDSIRIAWNLATGFAFDDSKSVKEKAIGFAKACIQGTIGMCQGALKGYEEGKGFFDTAAKMLAGGFDQGMKGYNKSLAMSTFDEQERAQRIIADIRAEHKKVLDSPDTSKMNEARKKIVGAEEDYIKELEGTLKPGISKEDLSKTVRSLELLQLSNAATSLQSTGFSFLQRLVGEQKDTTDLIEKTSKVTPEVLEKLGKDTLNITKNLNRILDDSTQSFPSKLWTLTKAYASAAQEGIKSFFQDFKGKDLKEKSINALAGGFSSFMSKFSDSLDNTKADSLEKSNTNTDFPEWDDEDWIEMDTLPNKTLMAPEDLPTISLESTSDEGAKEEQSLDMESPPSRPP